MTVYEYVKILAERENLPISELEKRCNLGNSTIKSWDKSVPKLDKIYEVAKYFGVSLEYFLTGQERTNDINIANGINNNHNNIAIHGNIVPELKQAETNPLTADEQEVLNIYRSHTPRKRAEILLELYKTIEEKK